ncbi:MAG: 2-phospho-L-lactate guanylyltransferase [Chloroflexota bacterium]
MKRLAVAKSRLAAVLDDDRRTRLVLGMLARTIDAVRTAVPGLPIALAGEERGLAERFGAKWLPDQGGLNGSLRLAADWAAGLKADGLLILPGDLALLEPADVAAILSVPSRRGIVVSPTHDGGTGALLLKPPGIIDPAFGPDSYRRHLAVADRAGVPATTIERDAFRFDLDIPDDLWLLDGSGNEPVGEEAIRVHR